MLIDTAVESQDRKTIVLRTQSPTDTAKLEKVLPRDQVGWFQGRWDGRNLVLEVQQPARPGREPEAEDPPQELAEIQRLRAMSREDLEALAAERGVKWEKKASQDTMIRRIAEAAGLSE